MAEAAVAERRSWRLCREGRKSGRGALKKPLPNGLLKQPYKRNHSLSLAPQGGPWGRCYRKALGAPAFSGG